MKKFDTPLRSHPIPWDHDFIKLEPTLHEDASKQFSAFLAEWFLRGRLQKTSISLFIAM